MSRHQLCLVGAFALSCVWLYASQNAGTALVASIREVSVSEARELLDMRGPVVIDVREKTAFDQGHIPGAIALAIGELPQRMRTLGLSATDPVLVYCSEGGARGPDVTRELNAAGYGGAVNLRGGFAGWQAAGQPVAR